MLHHCLNNCECIKSQDHSYVLIQYKENVQCEAFLTIYSVEKVTLKM